MLVRKKTQVFESANKTGGDGFKNSETQEINLSFWTIRRILTNKRRHKNFIEGT